MVVLASNKPRAMPLAARILLFVKTGVVWTAAAVGILSGALLSMRKS